MAIESGIIMFNRGSKMLVRALVSLYSLRKHYSGDVTFYVQNPCDCMDEFINSLKFFNCNVVKLEDKNEYKTLVMKNSLFENPPYDKTLWLDSDTIIGGPIDAMFSYLDEKNVDLCIPSFCGWTNDGHHMAKRINRFKGIVEEKYLKESLNKHLSVNTGVLSFRKSDKWAKFVRDWTNMADLGSKEHIFIPDECVANILIPSIRDWDLKCFICPTDYNVSVLHDHGISKDPKITHFHGDKHTLDEPKCELWKSAFKEMCEGNIANINSFLQHADKRLGQYLRKIKNPNFVDTTIVTACDEYYIELLKHTFPNWRKYKNIDKNPVIVFVHGMDVEKDSRLDFLRLPNVKMIPWKMDNAENHREEMLSAFVFGTAENVTTEYWLKLDADSYATDDRPFIDDKMKQFAFCGHRWGYSRPDHIRKLDEWAKGHWKRKLRKAQPMINEGRIEGHRFYHGVKRTISFIQLHKTKFTKFCVSLFRERKLPAPTQDTTMFYIANRFNPETVGVVNFKRDYGFTQGRGKMGSDHIRQCVEMVDKNVSSKIDEKYGEDEVEQNAE